MLRTIKRFVGSQDGNVAIIFGLTLFPLMFLGGAAVDYSRASDLHTRLQSAVDGNVLNMCMAKATTTPADLKKIATTAIQTRMGNVPVTVQEPVVTNDPRTVKLTGAVTYQTAFMKALGFETITVSANAKCSASETFYEIALVFDTTGSMASTSGSVSKMESARLAATKFVDFMFDTGALPGHVKMSIVPFAASVAVAPSVAKFASWFDANGTSPLHWQNVTGAAAAGFKSRLDVFDKLNAAQSTWKWDGCMESLAYPFNTNADEPMAAVGRVMPMFAPDEAGNSVNYFGLMMPDAAGSASNNSYMDDGPATTGNCQSDSAVPTRFTQACKYTAPKNKVTSSGKGPDSQCTSRPLTQLTATKAALTAEISQLAPSGSTNIHEGIVWGWRTLAPDSYFKDGAPYNKANTVKILVVMTDGMNQWRTDSGNPVNKSFYSAYGYLKNGDGTGPAARFPSGYATPTSDGDTRKAIDTLARETCTNARAKNIQIYTVGFSTPGDKIDADGLKLLTDCAAVAGRSFVATDENSIVESFASIAKGIGQLKIVQ
jgi:Flp pilus assembly protein TadG